MKKKLICCALVLCGVTQLYAQSVIRGRVADSGDKPLEFATAALLRADSSAITGVMTNDEGRFVIQNVSAGNYILQVSLIGYEKMFRNVNVPSQSDLGDITLTESVTRLQDVVVSAVRPLVVARPDRYIVNVSGNIQSAGRNAMNILQNTPGLLVNQQGGISVLGNSVEVWIDGRPSRMSGEQLQAFLNSMQGNEIDRIEVITNPSSRHDAAGSGGIIDIRTKKGLQFGMNGTLSVGYTQGRMDRENAGVSMNWRREKFNAFGNYTINRNNSWFNVNQTNVMQTPIGEVTFDQNALNKSTKANLHNSIRTGLDYFINSKNTFGVIFNAFHLGGGQVGNNGTTNISPAFNGVEYSTNNNTNSSSRNGIQANTNYQATFNKPGQQLNFDFDYARFNSNPFQQNANRYFAPDGAMIGNVELLRNRNPQTINVYSAKFDYVQPLWKGARMETGARISQTETDNDLKFDLFAGNEWYVDANQTNHFIYSEQIDAGYVNISQQLGKFSLQGGLRGEYTWSKGKQMTTGEVNDTSYFNLFPTFFVNYTASPKHIFGISYSRRLSRPHYGQLNPFEISIDAYSFVRGNPNLRPSYTHNIQLSHTFAQSLMTRISYSHTTDLIFLAPVADVTTDRYGLVQSNFGKSQNINAMMNYRKQILKIWTANMTVQSSYLINSTAVTSGEFVSEGVSLTTQLSNTITITPTLTAEITGMYMTGQRMGYFVFEPRANLSVGLRQMLLKNKMTISLNVNDVLNTTGTKVSAQYENVKYNMVEKYDNRFVSLRLSYNFGSTTVRAARNRTTGIEEETSRAGGR